MDIIFQPISSFYYSDGTPMFTLTGVLCHDEDRPGFRELYADWRFRNLDWGHPKKIDIPILSTKERLHLQEYLPCSDDPGNTLVKALGYQVDDSKRKSAEKMAQYEDFHRYYPYFVKAVP